MGLTNKPYGWVKNGEYVLYIDKPDSVFNYRPLYTHLVSQYKAITNTKIEPTVVSYTHPVKELTDEEKTELENALKVCEYKYFGSYPLSEKQWEAFELLEKHAKAILRKAQEK